MSSDIAYTHVIIDWNFTPADFFEGPLTVTREGYTVSLADGKVEARIDGAMFAARGGMGEQIQAELEGRFRAAQLLRHETYALSRGATIKVRPNGTRDIAIELQPVACKIAGGTVGILITDPEGKVVYDSEQLRREEDRALVDRVGAHLADSVLVTILKSYGAAVRDPDNELVYLYEIRDALSTLFGGDREARTALGTSAAEWRRFGQLCNAEPLRQGRHRGKTLGALRDATEGELVEARTLGKQLLEGYLAVLDGKGA
ncbi:hypothetical protein H4CHR_03746 [Variovorax sp. PBS-H4]|uniref:hypothetical protein n=1 Tax=Variovorax sp. PBS-H4 TaxID=434008 RepID=UPI001318C022|nr:hypothetical protein [Variovorax sp. PBS-H4]VTU35782.1 hypothetical protein H4CHR_03746 [Variovorax sp. PBS-H4]